ncbi:BBX [Mytilus edulis]|uniref:BBX n=1 Tax=Mytilus edulis TaxID=6550 RepID=A0A8S3VE10_MYTED|nr:BBX [Mytilus edulis]
MDADPDLDKKDVRRPMNAFLIFCKRHRSIVRERNPHLDNRSVTRILGDLWANIGDEEKNKYTDLAKQYKDAFMKANPDYKWHNPERMTQLQTNKSSNKPTNERVPSVNPSNMGGLSMLMEGIQVKSNQFTAAKNVEQNTKPVILPLLTGISPFQSWTSQQDFALEEERKLVIDEVNIKPEDKDTTPNPVQVKQEACSSEHLTNPDQQEENPDDPDDDAIYSCGKIVMDHIIDKLYLSTIKNIGQNKKSAAKKSPKKRENETIDSSNKPFLLPPLQGRKSYHTSIAVKNLLEFTRKAAARDAANIDGQGQSVTPMQEPIINTVSEAKQKLKDFCLKKEGRPKVVSGNENSGDSFDVKEFKRKRCYSESCAELYKHQEKRIKMESDNFNENGDDTKSTSPSNGDDYQPTRKSRRRNRGQRYQELINEGIIQPSKARIAAMKTEANVRSISFKESFLNKRAEDIGDEVLSVYPRQIRKRTMSESEKNRTFYDESSRYRTGDFDLEAHIKTLPACSLEKVVKPKRNIGKCLSESDSGNQAMDASSSPENFLEVKLTVPPHIKAKPTDDGVPVVGSRKRKARKHSITHLQPVRDAPKTDKTTTIISGLNKQTIEPLIETHEYSDVKGDNSSEGNELSSSKGDNSNETMNEMINSNAGVDSRTSCPDLDMGKNEILDKQCCKITEKSDIPHHSNILMEGVCNTKLTKLKDITTKDTTSPEETITDSSILSIDLPSFIKTPFSDQDENSNETDYCNYSNNRSSSSLEEKYVITKRTSDNTLCGSEDNVTMVTAVSVALPVTTEDSSHGDDRIETQNVQVSMSACDNQTSSVAMTTIQPSLPCLC